MPKIGWNPTGRRLFEAGLDRGVLFPAGQPGIAWDGLISVSEKRVSGSATPYYHDGRKHYTAAPVKDYSGIITAFDNPPEFDVITGIRNNGKGLSFDSQMPLAFNLAYRTFIGNDTRGTDYGYRIHLLSGLIAQPLDATWETIEDETVPVRLRWKFESYQTDYKSNVMEYRTDVHGSAVIGVLESFIYGSANTDPVFPEPNEISYIESFSP